MKSKLISKLLGFTGMALIISGCSTSYVEVKPSVIPPQEKSTYTIETSRKKGAVKINEEGQKSVGIIDLRATKDAYGNTILAYIDTNKQITFRYDHNAQFKISIDNKTFEGSEIKLNAYMTGENVFDMDKSSFVYIADKDEAIVSPTLLSDFGKLWNKTHQNDFHHIRTKSAIKKVFLLPKKDMQEVITITADNQILLWQLLPNKQVKLSKTLLKDSGEILFAKMSKSGKYLSFGDKRKLQILNISNAKLSATFNIDQATAIDFSPNEQQIIVASKSSNISEYDIEKNLKIREFRHDHHNVVNGLMYDSLDKNIITTAGDDGRLEIWEWIGDKVTQNTFHSFVDHWNSSISLAGGKIFGRIAIEVNENHVYLNPSGGRNHCSVNKFVNEFYNQRMNHPFYKKYSPNITGCSILGTKDQIIDFANKDILEQHLNTFVDTMAQQGGGHSQQNPQVMNRLRNFFLNLNGGQYFGLTQINGDVYAYGTGRKDAIFSYVQRLKPKPGAAELKHLQIGPDPQAYNCKECTVDFDTLQFSHQNVIEKFTVYHIHKFGSTQSWHDAYEKVESMGSNKLLAVKKNTVEIWNIQDMPKLENIIQENGEVYTIAYDKTKNLLAIGSSSKIIKIWDLNTMTLIGQLPGHTKSIVSLKFYNNGTKLISAGADDNTIKIWNITTMTNIKSIQNEGRSVGQISLFPNEDRFLFVNHVDGMVSNSIIRVYDTKEFNEIKTFSPEIGYIKAVKYIPETNQIFALSSGKAFANSYDHLFTKINVSTSEQKNYPFATSFPYSKEFIVDLDKKLIVVAGNRSALEVLDFNTLAKVKTIDFGLGEKGEFDSLTSLIYTEDKKLIAGSKLNFINILTNIQ